ncbi:MAG: hypothetical protein MOB07_04435 [Acidobacteria bacterium]|nr:hypothetical protein [Acidobacteriota bacterium]
MRSILKAFVVLIAALIFTACAPSLHPFFTDESTVFDEALLGTWINDSGDKCTFTKSGEDHYEFLYIEKAPARFEARLIKLGGVMYLDLYPETPDIDNGLYLPHIVRAHTLSRVTIGRDSISIAMLDGDWIRKLSDRNELKLAHERVADGAIVLTAPTGGLQAFLVRLAGDKEAFGDAEVFHRLGPAK